MALPFQLVVAPNSTYLRSRTQAYSSKFFAVPDKSLCGDLFTQTSPHSTPLRGMTVSSCGPIYLRVRARRTGVHSAAELAPVLLALLQPAADATGIWAGADG